MIAVQAQAFAADGNTALKKACRDCDDDDLHVLYTDLEVGRLPEPDPQNARDNHPTPMLRHRFAVQKSLTRAPPFSRGCAWPPSE